MSIFEYNQKEEEELIRREEMEIEIKIGEERERKNTERERRRADDAENEAKIMRKEIARLQSLLNEKNTFQTNSEK